MHRWMFSSRRLCGSRALGKPHPSPLELPRHINLRLCRGRSTQLSLRALHPGLLDMTLAALADQSNRLSKFTPPRARVVVLLSLSLFSLLALFVVFWGRPICIAGVRRCLGPALSLSLPPPILHLARTVSDTPFSLPRRANTPPHLFPSLAFPSPLPRPPASHHLSLNLPLTMGN